MNTQTFSVIRSSRAGVYSIIVDQVTVDCNMHSPGTAYNFQKKFSINVTAGLLSFGQYVCLVNTSTLQKIETASLMPTP